MLTQRGTQCKAAACRALRAPSATGKQDHPPPHPQQPALSPPAADAASLLSAHQHTLRWEIKPGEVGGMNTEQSVFASSSRVSSHEFSSFRATRSSRKLNIWTQVFVAQFSSFLSLFQSLDGKRAPASSRMLVSSPLRLPDTQTNRIHIRTCKLSHLFCPLD